MSFNGGSVTCRLLFRQPYVAALMASPGFLHGLMWAGLAPIGVVNIHTCMQTEKVCLYVC